MLYPSIPPTTHFNLVRHFLPDNCGRKGDMSSSLKVTNRVWKEKKINVVPLGAIFFLSQLNTLFTKPVFMSYSDDDMSPF